MKKKIKNFLFLKPLFFFPSFIFFCHFSSYKKNVINLIELIFHILFSFNNIHHIKNFLSSFLFYIIFLEKKMSKKN